MTPREKATDPYCQPDMKPDTKPDTDFRLEIRADLHANTRDEVSLPSGLPRGTPRFKSALEMKPEAPASNPDEDLSPRIDCSGIPRGLSDSRGDRTSLRVLEWVPEVTIFTRDEPCCNLRKTRIIPSKQAETIYGCGITREILPPLLSL